MTGPAIENSTHHLDAGHDLAPVTWAVTRPETPVLYPSAVAAMETRIAAIRNGTATECIWLLEHPALYTAGTRAQPQDLLDPDRFPVFQSGRGGQYTYHGPGQQVVYVMLDVKTRFNDVRRFVHELEAWVIDALAAHDIAATTHPDRVGVWVPTTDTGRHLPGSSPGTFTTEAKIAAIGVRLKRWVSMHGLAINVAPDLSHFEGIVPCGISQFATTSLQALGRDCDRQCLIENLRRTFESRFGPTCDGEAPLLPDATAATHTGT